jgi:hypothetical protein
MFKPTRHHVAGAGNHTPSSIWRGGGYGYRGGGWGYRGGYGDYGDYGDYDGGYSDAAVPYYGYGGGYGYGSGYCPCGYAARSYYGW